MTKTLNYEWRVRRFCPSLYEFTIQQNFEFSCLEAEYLGMQKEGESFRNLCQINRLEAMASVWGLVETMKPGEKFELVPFSNRQMHEIIKKKYKTKH